ncbi:hypothetical protein STANM309S_06636 [Streptomyces tanashiensis]
MSSGQGYEYLIKKFADDSGHTAQEFYTNRTLVDPTYVMLEPQPGESVDDPTCGTGGMLISTTAEVKRQGKEWLKPAPVWPGAQLRHLGDLEDEPLPPWHRRRPRRPRRHPRSRPSFDAHGRLRTFDVVLANPPYSIKTWNRDAFTKDPYGRNMWGVPPQNAADYAFIQHIEASLDPKTGRAAILLPHGVLNRIGEATVRKAMIDADAVEAVIGLAHGLFYNSGMEAIVLVLRKQKPADRKHKVLFIDAKKEFYRAGVQSFLSETHRAERAQLRHRGQGLPLRLGRDAGGAVGAVASG